MSLMDRTWDSSEPTALTILRCRKCRKCLVESSSLLSIGNSGELSTVCSVWHMNVDNLPDWVQTAVHQARWTVGKLNCPFCGARLGGFNFVNCSRCPCGQEDVVHVSKSRVDHDSKCPVVPLRPLKARMRSAGRTSSQDELRDPEGERMVRGGSEGCLPDAQSSCPAILRLIGTSTPITPPHRLATEAEQAEIQAALPTAASSQSLSGFCGISGLSCFGESSLKRLLDLAEVETVGVGVGVGEVRLSSEQDCPAPLAGLSCPLSPPSDAAEATSGGATHLGSSESPFPLDSGQQQDVGTPAGHVTLPQVLLHDEPHQASIPVSRVPTDSADGEGDEEEGDWAVAPRGQEAPATPPRAAPTVECQLSKREKNRLKSQRRKQRKIERWLRSQLEGSQVGVSPAGSEDEEEREGHTCAVCLDVYFSPYMCQPCGHVFCEPCLRTLAKNRPGSTPCPLCRTVISHVLFQKELNQTSKTFFPKEYLSRKQTFQKANYAKWPLPHCPKRFRIFWGFQREGARPGRWQFPNRPFGLDALDLVDMRAWPFDIDLVIIYVYSIHWILAFLILCFVGYCFFF